ncbi:hypothetical protein L2E82_39805 [Cichorium intybus]|uniref:Uncharacterized protein n=1 Tax=Cichorium intybus TaxID=13427 RepID=A0ACB9AIJ6_CICIN|nr:hypothetical protein L2E82_39805 [Cichorium intybus]
MFPRGCYENLLLLKIAFMSQKRTRVTWKQDFLVKTFLEACIHEVTTYGRLGGSLKATSWKAVADRLKTEHNFIVDQKQMKNQYDYLRGKYAVWVKLKNRTGNIYDPITNTFNLTDEEWELEAKSNKNVDKLRNSPLVYIDLCSQLFDGATSTGLQSWGPSSTRPRPTNEFFEHDFDDVQCTQMEPPGAIPASHFLHQISITFATLHIPTLVDS